MVYTPCTRSRVIPRSALTHLGFVRPEIPTLAAGPRSGDGWIHEIKYDGCRTLIVIDHGKVRAFSRHGRDWTGPYRRVVEAAGKLSCRAALIPVILKGMNAREVAHFSRPRAARLRISADTPKVQGAILSQ